MSTSTSAARIGSFLSPYVVYSVGITHFKDDNLYVISDCNVQNYLLLQLGTQQLHCCDIFRNVFVPK